MELSIVWFFLPQFMELSSVWLCPPACQNTERLPVHAMKACRVSEVRLNSLLTSVLEGGERPSSRPGRFTPLKEPRCKLAGGRQGPTTGLDDLPLPEFEPQITQPVALITALTAPSGLPAAASSFAYQ